MVLPFLILFVALAASSLLTLGTHPFWAQFAHGLQLILFTRRFQWPLVGIIVVCAMLLVVLIVMGRKRAWWLIGLVPLLMLFAHRFIGDPAHAMQICSQAQFIPADQANYVHDEDEVVGVVLGVQAYAYPYNILFQTPVVMNAQRDQRLLLLWSPFANRALATTIDRSIKSSELEIISMPANALLIYNSRQGQFINGVTGLTADGKKPAGFETTEPALKMPWKQWRSMHADTLVLLPPSDWQQGLPSAPVKPYYPMPGGRKVTSARAALAMAPFPCLVPEDKVGLQPLNMTVKQSPLLMLRGGDGQMRIFRRQANGDLTPRFYPASDAKIRTVSLTESDSASGWTSQGLAVAGALKGEKLLPYPVEDDVYEDVVKYWYPEAQVIAPGPGDVGTPPVARKVPPPARGRRMTRPALASMRRGASLASRY